MSDWVEGDQKMLQLMVPLPGMSDLNLMASEQVSNVCNASRASITGPQGDSLRPFPTLDEPQIGTPKGIEVRDSDLLDENFNL